MVIWKIINIKNGQRKDAPTDIAEVITQSKLRVKVEKIIIEGIFDLVECGLPKETKHLFLFECYTDKIAEQLAAEFGTRGYSGLEIVPMRNMFEGSRVQLLLCPSFLLSSSKVRRP